MYVCMYVYTHYPGHGARRPERLLKRRGRTLRQQL